MPSDTLAKLERLVNGHNGAKDCPSDADTVVSPDAEAVGTPDERVDATVLGELLRDTYANTNKSTDEISHWLIKTIEDFDEDALKDQPGSKSSPEPATDTKTHEKEEDRNYVSMRSFSRFLDTRRTRLRDIFSRIDKDRDATITLDDVYAYLEEHNLSYDPQKVAFVYSVFDKSGRGTVSYDDFIRHLLLVPTYGRRSDTRFFYRAYDFFVEDLEISSDSDVVISKDITHGLGYFYAGGIAGVVSRTCTAPFDRLKVYLIANSTHHSPLTIREAIKQIYTTGTPPGIRAFFTGNGLNILKVLPESAMKFGGFEAAKRMFARVEGVDDPAELSRLGTFLAGGIGGMIGQFCVYPVDTVKFRVQCASQSGGSNGSVLMRVLKNMAKEGGIRSFYRGLYVGVLGIFPFAALDLGIFSVFKSTFIKGEAKRKGIDEQDVKLGNLQVLCMGATSGSVGATVVYPVNLIRTRIQTQGTPAHPFTYNGFIDCWRQSVKREGWRGLFRGLGPNLAKAAPSVAISYLVYEQSKNVLGLP